MFCLHSGRLSCEGAGCAIFWEGDRTVGRDGQQQLTSFLLSHLITTRRLVVRHVTTVITYTLPYLLSTNSSLHQLNMNVILIDVNFPSYI